MTGKHRFFNNRFHRFNNRTFIFVDTFEVPFFYPYPYYGYYPYGYYGYSNYGYGSTSTVVEVQRRLARAGYYHGRIDGIMGPQTRRAIRAYERDHNMPAYGMINWRFPARLGLGWSVPLRRRLSACAWKGLSYIDDGSESLYPLSRARRT
jgi:hypothetical protein